ncbi:MAG: hypothetical protein KF760_15635 [Candidatus Eremiobacteraeota bacterium]|nr:hypothetical protein [Candidatus Eremiobacteraeota bacterium]MCW5870557.1 hypothetical protein [Candidatus Eremiobacteraeota bacterium]
MRWLLVFLLVSAAWAQPRFQILNAQLASDTVIGGEPIQVWVRLTGPSAGRGQLPVTTNRPDLCQALPVGVSAGQSEVRFALPTRAVETPTTVIVSVGAYGNIRDLQLVIQPNAPAVTQLIMPARLTSGGSGTVLIVLDRISPRSSSLSLVGNENVTIARSLPIPPGVRQFEASFTTRALRQGGKATLTYRGARTLVAESQLLPPVEVSDLQFTPAQIEGGQNGNGIITLKAQAGAAARVKLSGPANLRLPAEVTVPEGASSAQFSFASSTSRTPQNCVVTASTPLAQKSANLSITASTSLLAAEVAQYYVMASSKDGWLLVPDATGKKWRFKPGGTPKLGKLEPFGYTATLQGEGSLESDGTPHRLVVQMKIAGAKEDWRVTETTVVQVDGSR